MAQPLLRAPTGVLSAGNQHACALWPSGAAVCWGSNDQGQLNAPAGPFTALAARDEHTCGLTPTGAACWGYSLFGQATDQPGPIGRVTAETQNVKAF